jgi:hypothetical protein
VGYIVDALIRKAPKFPSSVALENYNIPFGAEWGGRGFLFKMSSFSHFLSLLDE